MLIITSCAADAGGAVELGVNDWPPGCLGYVFNLMRPAQAGHRRRLLHSVLGSVLAHLATLMIGLLSQLLHMSLLLGSATVALAVPL